MGRNTLLEEKANEQKIIYVITAEIKNPQRFFIPKYHVLTLSGIQRLKFYHILGKLMSLTTSIETKTGYIIIQTENYYRFLKEYYPKLYEVISDGR